MTNVKRGKREKIASVKRGKRELPLIVRERQTAAEPTQKKTEKKEVRRTAHPKQSKKERMLRERN